MIDADHPVSEAFSEDELQLIRFAGAMLISAAMQAGLAAAGRNQVSPVLVREALVTVDELLRQCPIAKPE
jgi:hypothetical protein